MYFGNYKRLVYLAQTDDPVALTAGRAAAERLGLRSSFGAPGLARFATAMASLTVASGAGDDRPCRAA